MIASLAEWLKRPVPTCGAAPIPSCFVLDSFVNGRNNAGIIRAGNFNYRIASAQLLYTVLHVNPHFSSSHEMWRVDSDCHPWYEMSVSTPVQS